MGLQGAEQDFRLVCAVYAGLDHLLEHAVDWSRSKVVRQMLHLLPVEVGAAVSVFIHVYTNCNSTWEREHDGCLVAALNLCKKNPTKYAANYEKGASLDPDLLKPQSCG